MGMNADSQPKTLFCQDCGAKMIPETPELQIETKETENVNTEKFLDNLPKGMKLRPQNPNCKGHYCADMDGQLCCLTPLEHIEDKDGLTPLFDVNVCSKNPKGHLEFSEVV